MSDELIKRLREHASNAFDGMRAVSRNDLTEAADALEAAATEAQRLREAMAWLDNHEPELVSQAQEKFGLALSNQQEGTK